MIHEPFEIEGWMSTFNLDRLGEEARGLPSSMQPEAGLISGPYDIAVLEQQRAEAFAHSLGVTHVPTDVFIWGIGDSIRREVTKIGGLPYREKRKPWPKGASGLPLTFVGQISFVDSYDLTPSLPGDILLIFAETHEKRPGEYEELLDDGPFFEWTTLDVTPVVTQVDIPEIQAEIMPCYGAIYRTWDYPEIDAFAYPWIAEHIPPIVEATKIGGICPWYSEWLAAGEVLPGTFLCSLSSVAPEIHKPFPFINKEQPITWEAWQKSHPLMIGDVGILEVFLAVDGTLRWATHTH